MPKPYQVQDRWFREAKRLGYRARSAFKLLEIQEKFKILKSGISVLDLGAAPGSWLQIEEEIVGPKGAIIGVDLQKIEPLRFAKTAVLNAFSSELDEYLDSVHPQPFSVILSDMAPATTGTFSVDQYRSVELCLRVLEVAKKRLKPGGAMVAKIFLGEDFNDFWGEVKPLFQSSACFKPKSCRDRSFEQFAVLRGFLGDSKKSACGSEENGVPSVL